MGENRRYSEGIERDIERVVRAQELRGTPLSLGVDEVRGTGFRRDIYDAPVPVFAWVRHRLVVDEPRQIEAEVLAYTDRTVLVRWRDASGEHHAWVYAGAVRRK